MERPALEGIVETCIYVSDVAQSRAFYTKVFGFTPVIVDDERICPLAIGEGRVLILFKRGATREPVPVAGSHIPPHDGGGEQHFAFGIPKDSVADWKSYLNALDIEIESEIDWPKGGTSLYFRDPDRLLVELITPGLWPRN